MADKIVESSGPVSDDLVVRTANLRKEFAGEPVVQDLTFEVPRGEIFGFIGPSGSGKTTTVRLLTGIYEPTAGEVQVLGHTPSRFSQQTRARLGYMPQLFALYPSLTVRENLNFAASIYGMSLFRRKPLQEMLRFVELEEHANKLAENISGGMQRRLSLAATLIHDPDLIFLDEPTSGIDPVLRSKFWEHFRELQKQGRTLFVTTQYVGEAAYCDQVGVMVEGRLLMVDSPEGLRRRAFGGEVVDLQTQERLDHATLEEMRALPFVQGSITRQDPTTVRIVVDQAATAIPALLEWCNGHNIQVKSTERYLPPFDDVFVGLVRREAPRAKSD